ncbi:hypothetical protein BXT95_28740 [Escherichia coli]|nr:hypothetical protein BXT95_28740 [Escherichia coli]
MVVNLLLSLYYSHVKIGCSLESCRYQHPGLFIGMYVAFFATLAVMLQSETLSGSVWLLVVLFILLNGFFFFDVYPRYRYEDIDVLDFRVCYNGEWYNTRFRSRRINILS